MITLRNWLETTGYDPSRAVALSIATDDLKATRGRIAAIGLSRMDDTSDGVTFYPAGADIEKSAPFSRISISQYHAEKREKARILFDLKEWLTDCSFLVSYTVDAFMWPWLQEHFAAAFADKEILDISCAQVMLELPYEVAPRNITSLNGTGKSMMSDYPHVKKIDTLHNNLCPDVAPDALGEELPLHVVRLYQVRNVFNHQLLF
jgi:hypothetical protein